MESIIIHCRKGGVRVKSFISFLMLLMLLNLLSNAALASMTPYFSPKGGCSDAIVREIIAAKASVLIQSERFTYTPLIEAAINAQKRGVKVIMILDRSQESGFDANATFLRGRGIETWIDYQPNTTHNNTIIIDESVLITGSYNFTKTAEEDNAENLLIIKNEPTVIKQYLNDFEKRKKLSRPCSDHTIFK